MSDSDPTIDNMSCDQFAELLNDVLDQRKSPSQNAELCGHAQLCAGCGARFSMVCQLDAVAFRSEQFSDDPVFGNSASRKHIVDDPNVTQRISTPAQPRRSRRTIATMAVAATIMWAMIQFHQSRSTTNIAKLQIETSDEMLPVHSRPGGDDPSQREGSLVSPDLAASPFDPIGVNESELQGVELNRIDARSVLVPRSVPVQRLHSNQQAVVSSRGASVSKLSAASSMPALGIAAVAHSESTSLWNPMGTESWVDAKHWIDQTMPAVESVREGVAPIGRSLRRAVKILAGGRGDRTS
ncbi:hypothetical protein N9N28_13905 [Rubripirellula amarantea]|nr:hypothetical protein [Rubripirellula amarantea]